MSKGKFSSSEWIPVDWNRSIRSRIWFCIEWCHFQSRENVGWKCHLDRFDYCWTYICAHVRYRKGNSCLQNEFPSIEIGLFDPEFDSASNDVTFNHGKTMGENVSLIVSRLLYIYMCPCTISERESRSSEWIPVDWNRSIRSRIWFCIEWCHFQWRENDGWICHLNPFDYCWTYICVHVWYRKENSSGQNEFLSMEIGLFDSEFVSASNDLTFIHGKTLGEKITLIVFFYTYRRKINMWVNFSPDRFFLNKSITFRCRMKFRIEWSNFFRLEFILYEFFIELLVCYG